MSDKSKRNTKQIKEMIEKFVTERTEMLSLYMHTAGIKLYEGDHDGDNTEKVLQEFCQVVLDYVAAGHFILYDRIINGTERRKNIADLARNLYPRIAESTRLVLNFNDKYNCEDHCQIDDSFREDLSSLGEALTGRIELEDQLLHELLS
ncbi:MAG: Rsd/AlgQ family anti-sigma factor [Gammaproteobacteria bacterium]|nr:Rsd/AlgQ family anti-sigma factor [Gammaproteobacteria bacterium]